MNQPDWRTRVRDVYVRHVRLWDLLFFAGGFAFDVVASRAGIDHAAMILQQVVYLLVIGGILYADFLRDAQPDHASWPPRVERLWAYRSLPLHFCFGTLMNLYSIFFLMSAGAMSSLIFVAVLFGAVLLNETRAARKSGVDVKVGFFVICVFCFFSLMIPMALGHVGLGPFLGSMVATVGVLAGFYGSLRWRLDARVLRRRLLLPGMSVTACFVVFYLIGFIPPVPVAAKKLGIYHLVERHGDNYTLFSERPAWKFWQSGDQDFAAQPGDKVYVFVAVFSPARFDDTVYIRWSHRERGGVWASSDRIAMHITGGRREGYRGFVSKENYTAGEWRVAVETSDARQIGRIDLTIAKTGAGPDRRFSSDIY